MPDIPDGDNCGEDTISTNKHLYEGHRDLLRWDQLPEILKKDGREILSIEGPGYCLIESIIAALGISHNITYQKDEVITFLSEELFAKPDYTRYLRVPISQEEVNFNLLNMTTSRKYSRLVADMYLPAIASAMNLHIRTIQNISGYYGILNTLPLNDKDEKSRKIITLIIQDDIYQPVVAISTEGNGTSTEENAISTEENAISTEANDRNGKEDPSKKALVFLSPQCTKKKSTSEVIFISDSEEEFTPVVIEPRDVEEISPPISPLPTYFDDGLLQQEEEPLEDIKWEDAVRRTSLGARKTSIDMKLFKGMIPDVVTQIPHDINGLKYYAIDIPEDQTFFSRYRDGRYFDMNSSTRKGFRGVRRIGGCRGNFICTNKDCAYLIENRKENQHQFITIGKNKFCYVCNGIVYRRPCGAVKMIEYHVTMRLLEVYHQGEHTCQVKPETTLHDKAIEESIKRYGVRVTPKEIAQMRMTEELKKQFDSGEHDMNKIVDIGS